jgi:hypothetical protein
VQRDAHLIHRREKIPARRLGLPPRIPREIHVPVVHACMKGMVSLEAWARVSVSRGDNAHGVKLTHGSHTSAQG